MASYRYLASSLLLGPRLIKPSETSFVLPVRREPGQHRAVARLGERILAYLRVLKRDDPSSLGFAPSATGTWAISLDSPNRTSGERDCSTLRRLPCPSTSRLSRTSRSRCRALRGMICVGLAGGGLPGIVSARETRRSRATRQRDPEIARRDRVGRRREPGNRASCRSSHRIAGGPDLPYCADQDATRGWRRVERDEDSGSQLMSMPGRRSRARAGTTRHPPVATELPKRDASGGRSSAAVARETQQRELARDPGLCQRSSTARSARSPSGTGGRSGSRASRSAEASVLNLRPSVMEVPAGTDDMAAK